MTEIQSVMTEGGSASGTAEDRKREAERQAMLKPACEINGRMCTYQDLDDMIHRAKLESAKFTLDLTKDQIREIELDILEKYLDGGMDDGDLRLFNIKSGLLYGGLLSSSGIQNQLAWGVDTRLKTSRFGREYLERWRR